MNHKMRQRQFKREMAAAQKEYKKRFGAENIYNNPRRRNPFERKEEPKVISTVKKIITKILRVILKIIILILVMYLYSKN